MGDPAEQSTYMADSALDTGHKYIKELFQKDRFYNIPEYQRPYVWGPEQVRTMCEDLAAALAQDKNREYFLGCMIWNSKRELNHGTPHVYHDILDGQQRFITLYLLHAVVRDLSTNASVKSKVGQRLQQEGDDLEEVPERNRLQFSIRQDEEFFQQFVLTEQGTRHDALLAELAGSASATTSVRNMATALRTLHVWWAEQLRHYSAEEAFQKYLHDFLAYLGTRVLVLYLSTSDNLDAAYNLFTVLNSRGLQLQASDILRTQNLGVVADEAARRKYAARWDDYQSAVENVYSSFDDFLWTMITILVKYRDGASTSNIGNSFNFIYKQNLLQKGAATFDFMGRYVQHLEAVFTANYQAEEYGCLYENLNYILYNTFGSQYLVVLMHYRACFGDTGLLEFLLKIDNLFSAAWLTSSFSILTRIFTVLRRMEEVRESYPADKPAAATAFLQDDVLRYDYQDEKAHTRIDLPKFFQLLDEEHWGSFSGTRINKTRYLLLKLDLLTGNLNNKLFLNKAQASLEHILPQKPKAPAWQVSEEYHAAWLHRLGNVVLVDTKKNASLSNSSFLDKRHKYSTYIEGRANTNYVFITYQQWDEPTLKQNHDRVVNLLKSYYTGNSLQTLKEIRKKALVIPAAVPA
jgi:uncharacterized protein with ParB-like and HNH nuclease domain